MVTIAHAPDRHLHTLRREALVDRKALADLARPLTELSVAA